MFAIASMIAVASGCKKNEPAPAAPQPAPVAKPKPVQNVASSSARTATQKTANQFDFSSKKDPFKPYIAPKPVLPVLSAQDQKSTLKNALPIHSFEVNQFKLIGVVTSTRDNQAMVVDPTGKGYVIKVGMTIGKNNGRVTAITTNGVDVVEQFKDESGRVRKENQKITLPRKQ